MGTRGAGMARMKRATLAVAALLAALPAGADVKAGVDAWSRGEFARAVQEWRPLAIAGDADAQFNMGQAYKLGRGVPVNLDQAQSWFKRAADQGHIQAQDNYGIGLFQANRHAEAAQWLERSVARGEPRAQLVLATMLFNGDGVKADYPRAYALMTRASQAGLSSASQSLAQMDGFISPADREQGMQLARRYAAETRATGAGTFADRSATVASAHTPSANVTRPSPARAVRSSSPRTPEPAAKPRPAPATPAPTRAARTGAWRIQLGAFRERGNAKTLWTRVRGRLRGAQPAYVAGGGVTRLQATGFASRAEAQRACTAAGVACVVIAP